MSRSLEASIKVCQKVTLRADLSRINRNKNKYGAVISTDLVAEEPIKLRKECPWVLVEILHTMKWLLSTVI